MPGLFVSTRGAEKQWTLGELTLGRLRKQPVLCQSIGAVVFDSLAQFYEASFDTWQQTEPHIQAVQQFACR